MISAAASAAVRRPRRAVQRTSAIATGAAGSRYFGPEPGQQREQRRAHHRAAQVGPLAHAQRASTAPASIAPAVSSG